VCCGPMSESFLIAAAERSVAAGTRPSEELIAGGAAKSTVNAQANSNELSPSPTLETLPVELQHKVFTLLLNARDVDRYVASAHKLAGVSTTLRNAYTTIPSTEFKMSALSLLSLSPLAPDSCATDWRRAYERTRMFWQQLASLQPFTEPDETQKYLRHIADELRQADRAPAEAAVCASSDSPTVRRAIVGLSLMPSSLQECFRAEDGRWQPHVRAAVQFLFAAYRAIAAPKERVDEAASRHFSFDSFERLARWMLFEPQSSDEVSVRTKLRLLMAEHEQIQCRDASEFIDRPMPRGVRNRGVVDLEALTKDSKDRQWRGGNRQFGSFSQLIRLAECREGNTMDYWA